jgi:hypothetical protein
VDRLQNAMMAFSFAGEGISVFTYVATAVVIGSFGLIPQWSVDPSTLQLLKL